MPTISIITATLKTGETRSDCPDSVVRQDMDVEHIVVEGQSADQTLQVVEQYRDSIANVVSEAGQGVYDVINKGLSLAGGEVIGMLSADDYYPSPDILFRVAGVFENPDINACYGDLCYLDGRDPSKVVRYRQAGEYQPRQFYWGWMPPHPTFFVRRSAYEKHGLKAAQIPGILVHMRTGGVSNATLANRLAANRMDKKAWVVNDLQPYPWTL